MQLQVACQRTETVAAAAGATQRLLLLLLYVMLHCRSLHTKSHKALKSMMGKLQMTDPTRTTAAGRTPAKGP
jgi:hypothetical protein